MAPTPYKRTFSFTGSVSANPNFVPAAYGSNNDGELDQVAACTAAIIASLNLIQRSDGALANGIVTLDSMAPGLLAIFQGYINQSAANASAAAASAVQSANGAVAAATYAAASQGSANSATGSATAAAGPAWAAAGSALTAQAAATQAVTSLAGGAFPAASAGVFGMTRSAFATTIVPTTVSAIVLAGYAAIGDLGAGARMIRGTSAGYNAIQDATGAWWNLDVASLRVISVGYFGAVDDDATDNTAAFQACAAVCNATTKVMHIPGRGGIFRVGRSGTPANGAGGWVLLNTGFCGEGMSKSYIRNMSPTANLIYASRQTPFRGENVNFLPGTTTPTAAACICLDAPSGQYSTADTITNCAFGGQNIDILANRCDFPYFGRNFSNGYIQCHIALNNQDNEDYGDQVITDSVFDTNVAGAFGIIQYGAGGLKATGNKCQGGTGFYSAQFTGGTTSSTSDLIIANNSIENCAGPVVAFNRANGSTMTFGNIQILDNQFAIDGPTLIDVEGTWLNNIKIAGNILGMVRGGSAIVIVGAQNFDIWDNSFIGFFSGAGTVGYIGINIDATASGRIGQNTFVGCDNPVNCASQNVKHEWGYVRQRPQLASPTVTAGPQIGTGYQTVQAFVLAPPANGRMIVDLYVDGTVAGFAGCTAVATYLVRYDGTGFTVTVLNQASLPAYPANPSTTSASFTFTYNQSGAALQIGVAFNAPAAGTSFQATCNVKAGIGQFAMAA